MILIVLLGRFVLLAPLPDDLVGEWEIFICLFTITINLKKSPVLDSFSLAPWFAPTVPNSLSLSLAQFSFLMTEAILLFSPHSSPVFKLKHQTKSRLHWLLQMCCVCCAVLGFASIAINKNLNGKPHITTWHGLIGVVTLGAVAMQSLAALPLLYHKLAKGRSLAKLKRYHAASGLLVYLLGVTSLLLGMRSGWYTERVGGYAWYLTTLCPVFAGLMIMSQVNDAYVTKKRMQS